MAKFNNENAMYNSAEFDEYQTSKNKAIEENLSDDRLDEKPILQFYSKIPMSRVIIGYASDLHIGGQGTDYARAKAGLEVLDKFFNGFTIIGGDLLDNANQLSATSIYSTKATPSQQILAATNLLRPFLNNIPFVLGGNHDSAWGNRNKSTNIGPEEVVANNLKKPFVPYTAVFHIKSLLPNGESKWITVAFAHQIKNVNRFISFLASKGIYTDAVITEHVHSGLDESNVYVVPKYDKNGILVDYENKTIPVLIGKTMQNGSATVYGAVNFFSDSANIKAVLLGWEKNPNYTSNDTKQPKYNLMVNPFSVLQKDSNKPTMFANLLLKYYQKPSIKSYKSKLQKESLTKASAKLSSALADNKNDFENYLNSKKTGKNKSKSLHTEEEENVK